MARAHKTDCKGTTFFWNTQIFSEKNVFFLIKSMIILRSLYVHEVILTLKCVTFVTLVTICLGSVSIFSGKNCEKNRKIKIIIWNFRNI